MEAIAKAKYIRVSPRKARKVAEIIKGQDVAKAEAILSFMPDKGAKFIGKVLHSAIANAEDLAQRDEHSLNRDDLYVKNAIIDQGPSLKRFMPRAMGRADRMLHRTSHITVIVAEREGDK